MTENDHHSTENAWEDVGNQFKNLGDRLEQAFQTTINNEDNKKKFSEMEKNVTSALNHLSDTIEAGLSSPEGEQLKDAAKSTATSLREAGEKTAQEIRPHLLNALQQVNQKLDLWLNTMNQTGDSKGSTGSEDCS